MNITENNAIQGERTTAGDQIDHQLALNGNLNQDLGDEGYQTETVKNRALQLVGRGSTK